MLFELLKELYMYEDDINTIEFIADTFQKWCIANKYFNFEYEILDYRKKFCTNDIIIIHLNNFFLSIILISCFFLFV